MDIAKVKHVKAELKRFSDALNALEKSFRTTKYTRDDGEECKYYTYSSRDSAAAKRASLDLMRSMVAFRKP